MFSPDVPIRLDYHGKRVDMEHGTLTGLLVGLGHLNCSQLKLKRIHHRRGYVTILSNLKCILAFVFLGMSVPSLCMFHMNLLPVFWV